MTSQPTAGQTTSEERLVEIRKQRDMLRKLNDMGIAEERSFAGSIDYLLSLVESLQSENKELKESNEALTQQNKRLAKVEAENAEFVLKRDRMVKCYKQIAGKERLVSEESEWDMISKLFDTVATLRVEKEKFQYKYNYIREWAAERENEKDEKIATLQREKEELETLNKKLDEESEVKSEALKILQRCVVKAIRRAERGLRTRANPLIDLKDVLNYLPSLETLVGIVPLCDKCGKSAFEDCSQYCDIVLCKSCSEIPPDPVASNAN